MEEAQSLHSDTVSISMRGLRYTHSEEKDLEFWEILELYYIQCIVSIRHNYQKTNQVVEYLISDGGEIWDL